MKTEKIGGLDTLVAGDRTKPTIVLFHGYRASAADLYPIHRLDPHYCWVFPNGPISLEMLPGVMGYAWFDIDLEQIMMQVALGDDAAFEKGFPSNIDTISKQIHTFLNALAVEPSRLILGGFSQGGIVATEIGLTLPDQLRGLLLLSTTLVHQERLKSLKPQPTSFFQSHGRQDEILPFKRAEQLTRLLSELGLKGRLHAFNGGHELPPDILGNMRTYLTDLHET